MRGRIVSAARQLIAERGFMETTVAQVADLAGIANLITHAALHVPRQLVQEVRRQAHLFGVFILPSGGELDLEYLDLLEGHAVVDNATLQQRNARAAAATKIVDDAAKLTETIATGPTSQAPRSLRTNEEGVPPSLRPGRASIPPSIR
mgnify:CR=1 FL=1